MIRVRQQRYFSTTVLPVTTTPFTVAAWVNMDEIATSGLWALKDTGHSWDCSFGSDGRVQFRCEAGAGTATAQLLGFVVAGQWHHITCVAASATSRTLYADELSVSNTTSRAPTGVTTLRLCRGRGSEYLVGRTGEYVIWDVALTADEVRLARKARTRWQLPQRDRIVRYWPLATAADLWDRTRAADLTIGSDSGDPTLDFHHTTPGPRWLTPIQPIPRWSRAFAVEVAGDSLIVADALHGHSADNVVLSVVPTGPHVGSLNLLGVGR